MKLFEEFKLYENMWEELSKDKRPLKEAMYPYKCIHCGGTAHFAAHDVPEDEEAIHTPVGLLHKKCWDAWNDPDEMDAYNYYGFAHGDFTLSKAERLRARKGWENCRKAGKIYMDDYKCDSIEREFNTRDSLADKRNKKEIFFGAFTDCHVLEYIYFITEDEAEASNLFKDSVNSFFKTGPDSYCRCELLKATVSASQFKTLMRLKNSEGGITVDSTNRTTIDAIYSVAEGIDEEVGGRGY